MKVLVIGGMHGNEPLGINLVKMLRNTPIKNVDAIFANEQAIEANVRFTKQDLNRSFPGSPRSKTYETNRAAELVELTKSYDVVLDFHNTHCPNNDCSFVGECAKQKTYDVSRLLGLNRVIVADYDCINKYANNCVSIEISLGSNQNNVRMWYEKICNLANLDRVEVTAKIEKYHFVYRITLEDRDKLDLPNMKLEAFKPIDAKIAKSMGVENPAYPIFIGDKYTPYNYGGLLNRLDK